MYEAEVFLWAHLEVSKFLQADDFLVVWNDYLLRKTLPVGWLLEPIYSLSQPVDIYTSVRLSGNETLASSL